MGSIMQVEFDRREHPRQVTPQLYARVNGDVYQTMEWSFGGLVLHDRSNRLQTGALIRVEGLIDEPSYRKAQAMLPVDIRARVIRSVPEKQQAAVSCLQLDDAAFAVLQAIRDGLPLPAADPV